MVYSDLDIVMVVFLYSYVDRVAPFGMYNAGHVACLYGNKPSNIGLRLIILVNITFVV